MRTVKYDSPSQTINDLRALHDFYHWIHGAQLWEIIKEHAADTEFFRNATEMLYGAQGYPVEAMIRAKSEEDSPHVGPAKFVIIEARGWLIQTAVAGEGPHAEEVSFNEFLRVLEQTAQREEPHLEEDNGFIYLRLDKESNPMSKEKKTVWVLTSEYNEYDQNGVYFVAVFADRPTVEQIIEETHTSCKDVKELLLFALHVQKGGGRQNTEHSWYHLNEVTLK